MMVCGSVAFCEKVRVACKLMSKDLYTCTSGERFRAAVAEEKATSPVIIGPDLKDVAPINLVAALTADGYGRGELNQEIYLFTEQAVTGSLASRAISAGARQVLTLAELPEFAARFEPGALTPTSVAKGPVSKGIIISLMSGRGGCGKTTVALLSALALADEGFSVALIDMDLQFGDLSFLLQAEAAHDLAELAMLGGEPSSIASQLSIFETSIASEVAFFAAPRKPEDADVVTPHLDALLEAFALTYDITIVNTGTFWDETAAALVRSSTRIALVIDQRMCSLDSCKRTLDLCIRLGAPLARIVACLNRYDPKGVVDEINASIALKGIGHFTVADGGREVEELISLGCPEDLFMLKNPCAVSLRGSLEDMMPELGLPLSGQHHKVAPSDHRLFSTARLREKARL